MRLPLLAGALFFASILSCGREITGIDGRGGRAGEILLDPRFATVRLEGTGEVLSIGSVVEFVEVRVVIRREDGSIAVDTLVPFPPTVESISLRLTIPLDPQAPPAGEPMSVTMKYVSAAGDTVFSGGPLEVVAKPASTGAAPTTQIDIGYVGVGADAKSITISPPDYTGLRLAATSFSATVLDSSDVPLPLAPVAFTSTDSQRVHVNLRTGATTLLGARGSAKIIAQTLTGQADSADVTITPVATSVIVVSGGSQQTLQGVPFPNPVRVRALAVDNLGVEGVVIAFDVLQGQGTLSQGRDTTDANGDAEVTWTAGDSVGSGVLRASIYQTTTGVNIPGTQLSDAANHLTFSAQPPNILAGDAIPSFTVVVRDVTGDTVASYNSDVQLALAGGTAGANLLGTTTATAVNGVAVFTGLTVDRGGSGYRLVATLPGLPGVPAAQTATFNVAPAPPYSIIVANGSGQTAPASTVLPDSIKVRVRDQFSLPIVGATVTFSVLQGGGSVAPPSAVTDASGFAATQWTVGAGGAQQLSIATPGLSAISVGATVMAEGGEPVLFLGLDSAAVALDRSRQIPVFLTNATPSDLLVTLTMRDAVASWSAPSITIPAGGNQALPSVTGLAVGSTWAVASSAAGTDSVRIVVDSLSAIIDGPSIQYLLVGDTLRTLVLLREPAPAGGVTLTVRSSDSSLVVVAPGTGLGTPEGACYGCTNLRAEPSTTVSLLAPLGGTALVTVPEGQVSAHLVVVALAVETTVGLTLEGTGIIGTGTTIFPRDPEPTIYLNRTTIAPGLHTDLEVYRSHFARTDQVVRVRSLNPTVAIVDTIAYLKTGDYNVYDLHARGVSPGTAEIVAEVAGLADTVLLTVAPGRLLASADFGGVLDLSARSRVRAYLGADVGGFFDFAGEAAAPVMVDVVSRDPGVMRLAFDRFRVTEDDEGLVEVDPVGAGSTWIVMSAAGFGTDSINVSVSTGFSLSIYEFNARTGVGLVQDDLQISHFLSGQAKGLLPVTVTSSDPSVALVHTPTVTMHPDYYYGYARIQGMSVGTANIVVSAPGTIPDTVAYQVYVPQLNLFDYQSPSNLAPDSVARGVAMGLSDGAYSRGAADTIRVTLRSTDPSVLLVTDSILEFVPGSDFATNVEFRARAPGTAQLTLEAPGFAPDTTALLTVVPRLLTFSATTLNIGRGLQTGTSVGRNSSRADPLAFTVTVQGPLGTSVAIPNDAIQVSAQSRSVTVRGGNVIGGTDTLIVTAVGHAPDTVYVNVGGLQADIVNYLTTMDVGQAYDGVQARLGNDSPIIYQQPRDTSYVALISRDPSIVEILTDTLRILPGQPFTLGGSVVARAPGTTWFVATPVAGGLSDSVQVNVVTPKITFSDFGPLNLATEETTYLGQYYLYRPFADDDSLWVQLASTAPGIVAPVADSVLFEPGFNYAFFQLTSGDTTGSALITASAQGYALAAKRAFVTRAHFELYVPHLYLGGATSAEVYRVNANYEIGDVSVPIPIRLTTLDSTIAVARPDTLVLFPGFYSATTDSLHGLTAGRTQLLATDERVGEFARTLDGSTPVSVEVPRLEHSISGELQVVAGATSPSSDYIYMDGESAPVWVHVGSVGGRFAASVDSVLLGSFDLEYFEFEGIALGIDTLVISAAGFPDDSIIVRVVKGALADLGNFPLTIRQGDSVAVYLELRHPDFNYLYAGVGGLGFTITSGGSVQATLGAGPITSVSVNPGLGSMTFYVKATDAGTGTISVTHPNFESYSIQFTTRSP